VLCLLKDWIQYEEVSSEDALPSDVCETDGFNSSLYATKSSLSDQLANLPDVIVCPKASGDENEDVSCITSNWLVVITMTVVTVLSEKRVSSVCYFF